MEDGEGGGKMKRGQYEIHFWTDEDDRILTEMWMQRISGRKIAEVLKRKPGDIYARRWGLGLPSSHELRNQHISDPAFMEKFKELYNAGASFSELKDRMGLEQYMVYKMIEILKLPYRKEGFKTRGLKRIPKRKYSEEDVAKISEKVDEGLNIQTIADQMGFDYDAVNSILSRYRLRKNARRAWTPEEDTVMIELLESGLSIEGVCRKMKRTPLSISGRCSKIGLSGKFSQVINVADKTRKEDLPMRLCLKYRLGAIFTRRGYACDLTLDFLLDLLEKQEGKCYYTGIPMVTTKRSPYIVSVDRKDSSRGYERDNVVLACWRANKMKQEFSVQDFVETCKLVAATAQSRQNQQVAVEHSRP